MTSFFMTSLRCQVYVCMHNNFFMTSFSLTSVICSSVQVNNSTLASLRASNAILQRREAAARAKRREF